MQYFEVSYHDDETGENFELRKEIDSPFIYDWINVMIDVLRQIGYGDGLIESFLGETYFTKDSRDTCEKSIRITPPTVNVDEVIKRFTEEFSKALSAK